MIPESISHQLASTIRKAARPLNGTGPQDYDPLLAHLDQARLVLLGEASHGTHEFYQARAVISRRLITEKGFNAVAVEADWPDAYRVNCYIQGRGSDKTAAEALSGFTRFPTWMWRNTDVEEFVEWLRRYNREQPEAKKVGFYGLDLYSLHSSIESVIDYLDRTDPEAAQRARFRYSCFEDSQENPEIYGYTASFDMNETCRKQVISALLELQQKAPEYARRADGIEGDEAFFAVQNARVVKNAEEYYRTMFDNRKSSWNLRDTHMAETLDELLKYLDRRVNNSRVVVWAHNSHLGDARATQMGQGGELNVGQLVRERYGNQAVLVGFSTYTGTVAAASDWGAPVEIKRVRPGLENSYELLFHQVGLPAFYLDLTRKDQRLESLHEPRLERAIGVIYRPQSERVSHYFWARLPEQFDALLYFDETTAVEPLDRAADLTTEEVPETFPTAL
ncbi:MAG: erythromycin esterase [Chloroflexi bacterium]|nr:erythromycin esterase [Chloroflexota bacterium]